MNLFFLLKIAVLSLMLVESVKSDRVCCIDTYGYPYGYAISDRTGWSDSYDSKKYFDDGKTIPDFFQTTKDWFEKQSQEYRTKEQESFDFVNPDLKKKGITISAFLDSEITKYNDLDPSWQQNSLENAKICPPMTALGCSVRKANTEGYRFGVDCVATNPKEVHETTHGKKKPTYKFVASESCFPCMDEDEENNGSNSWPTNKDIVLCPFNKTKKTKTKELIVKKEWDNNFTNLKSLSQSITTVKTKEKKKMGILRNLTQANRVEEIEKIRI